MTKMILTHPAAAPFLPLTEAALCVWVGTASPGDRLSYHQGYLAIDAAPCSTWRTPADRHELRRTASRAWQLAEQGLVHLVQRRDDACNYTYFVVARHRPRTGEGGLQAVLQAAALAPLAGHYSPSRRSA